ncbi:MAG: tyrosine-protein phosphatase [Ruminococcaceae bacterium]|nr:tyrosine-protein phosphatase [Oscillospiraceae bacterium]
MKDENKDLKADENIIDEIKADESAESCVPEHSEQHHHTSHSHHSHHSHHGLHSGHSHHRSRHSHHRHSQKNKDNKFIAFIKSHKSVLVNIISCTVSVALLVIMATTIDFSKKSDEKINVKDITQSTIKIETPVFSEKISLANNAILYYMNSDNNSGAVDTYRLFDGYKGALNFGLPANFTYLVAGIPNGVEVVSAELELSENSDYENPAVYKLNIEDSEIDIYNLKTGTKYYYRIKYILNNDCEVGTIGSFETEKSPRIMNIDGAVNVRDIGGWTTIDGKTVKQGLLYRGSELDGAVKADYKLTEKGLKEMLRDLGIRFDMDLRAESENQTGIDALGKGVKHIYYGIPMYADIFKPEYNEAVRDLFAELSDESNYPVYMHCTYGVDRTGTICYLLEALLGLPQDALYQDYELSAFTSGYINPAFNGLVEYVNTLDGATVKEKVENYLISIGVTAQEISDIREILLEN